MTRHRYPADCPVFEMTMDFGIPGPRCGDIVVGVAIADQPLYLGAINTNGPAMCAVCGDSPWLMTPDELRPLTRTAREMLAIVTASRKGLL